MKQRLPNKQQEHYLDEAIKYIKSKGFGYIKFELEATIGRGNRNRTPKFCKNCDMTGYTYAEGKVVKCKMCEYGMTNGVNGKDFTSDSVCQTYMLSQMSEQTRKNLVYGRFYHDGSVDSEYTCTVAIENVRDMVDIINSFIKLAEINGGGMDTAGAGMHIALLNSSNGNYPSGNNLDSTKLSNFTSAINKLMPALFFLGSADHRSRPSRYREPQVSGSKYSAINYGSGVLEYRVFETSYINPYRIYEFVEVIAKSLVFYDTKQQLPAKITVRNTAFSIPDNGNLVRRMFDREDTYSKLELTLPFLKPDSRTLEQLNRERGFKLNPQRIELERKIKAAKIFSEWPEYLERLKLARESGSDVSGYPQTVKQFMESRGHRQPTVVQERVLSPDWSISAGQVFSVDYATATVTASSTTLNNQALQQAVNQLRRS